MVLEAGTGKACFLMSHTAHFSPEFRDRRAGLFTIGYVGPLCLSRSIRKMDGRPFKMAVGLRIQHAMGNLRSVRLSS
jgi:hypothetical protein